jgi:hypothetical protein
MKRSMLVTAVALVALVLVAGSAVKSDAQELCFSGFGGTVFYVFNAAGLTSVGRVVSPLAGRISGTPGTLAQCAGLSEWPIFGSAVVSGGQVTLAFRAMTVDAAACGAVDNIANFNLFTGSGSLQIFNQRSGFSNTTTFTSISCANAPGASAEDAPSLGGDLTDPLGNVRH